MFITITAGLMATAEATGDDSGNLALGLLIGAIGLVCGIWWIFYRFQAGRRRRADSRDEHEMLREINELRPEQKAVERVRPRIRLRRGGF